MYDIILPVCAVILQVKCLQNKLFSYFSVEFPFLQSDFTKRPPTDNVRIKSFKFSHTYKFRFQ